MGSARAIGCLLLAVSAGGCNSGDSPKCVTGVASQSSWSQRPPGRVGIGYTVQLQDPMKGVSCALGPETASFPTSVSAVLLDPNGGPAPVSVSNPLPQGAPISFSFTPQLPGAYHLTVGFEPDFGTAQTDILIAADRDAGLITLDVPRECARFDRIGDVTVCLRPEPDAGTVFTVVNGQLVSEQPGFDFAVAPGLTGIWLLAPNDAASDLVQLVAISTEGLLTLFAEAQLDLPVPADARLIAHHGTALVLGPPSWAFASYDDLDVDLDLHDDATQPIPLLPLAQWNTGKALQVLGGDPGSLHTCTLSPVNASCSQPSGRALGTTAHAVWFYDEVTQTTGGISLSDDGAVSTLTLPLSDPDARIAWPVPDSAPHWTLPGGVVVLGFDGSHDTLDFYPFDLSDATWFDADARHLWKWSATTNQLTYVDR